MLWNTMMQLDYFEKSILFKNLVVTSAFCYVASIKNFEHFIVWDEWFKKKFIHSFIQNANVYFLKSAFNELQSQAC